MAVVYLRQHDRATDREAVIVSTLHGASMLTGLIWVHSKRDARIERLVDQVVIHGSVDLIGSRLHRVVEETAPNLSVFRREVACLDRDFLDGIHTRLHLSWSRRYVTVAGILSLDAE